MKKAGISLLCLFVLLLLAGPVFAENSFITSVMEPYASISIAEIYLKYANIVDFFIVFVIFGSIAKFVFGDKYGPGSKNIALVVGLAMALAFAVFEKTYNWNFGTLGPLSLLMFVGLLLFFIGAMLRKFGTGSRMTVAIIYILSYIVVGAFFPQAFTYLNQNASSSAAIGFVLLAVNIGLISAVVWLIICLVNFKNKMDT